MVKSEDVIRVANLGAKVFNELLNAVFARALLEETAKHFRMTLGPGTSAKEAELMCQIEDFLNKTKTGGGFGVKADA